MDCIFCKIVQKEIPSQILYEDGDIIVITDIHPKAPIHNLVIPREHIESIMHLGSNHEEIISKMIFRAKAAAEKIGLKGYKLVFNVGREGGQIIDHLHLHLLGGWTRGEDVDAMPHP